RENGNPTKAFQCNVTVVPGVSQVRVLVPRVDVLPATIPRLRVGLVETLNQAGEVTEHPGSRCFWHKDVGLLIESHLPQLVWFGTSNITSCPLPRGEVQRGEPAQDSSVLELEQGSSFSGGGLAS